MNLLINGQLVPQNLIDEDIEKMRKAFESRYSHLSKSEKEKQLLKWAQENVVERILIIQEAKKDQRPVCQKRIDELLNKFIEQNGGYGNLRNENGEGETGPRLSKLKAEIENKIKVERLVKELNSSINKPNYTIAKQYYEQNIKKYWLPAMVHAAQIVKHGYSAVELEVAEREINLIYSKLKDGEVFEKLADKYSDCPGSGGELGYFSRGQMVESFDNVVFNMKEGEISRIFKTEFGYHIVKVHARKGASQVPFERIKDDIVNELWEDLKLRKLEDFVDNLKKAAVITLTSDKEKNINEKSIIKSTYKYVKPLSNVLVKPCGPDCNLHCEYCFYRNKSILFGSSKTKRMSIETLEELIRQAMARCGSTIYFGWQGGEPTLMGLDFFQKVVDLQQKYGEGKTVGNGIQTNGVMIDYQWAEFFHKYNFLVGLSIDGPEKIHNYYRKTSNGRGTWNKVNITSQILLENDVQVNALAVVSDYSSLYPEMIYEFLKSIGIHYHQYIPCIERDPYDSLKLARYSVAPERYAKFLCKLFDLWIDDFSNGIPTTSIRYFDSVFHNYVGMTSPECTLLEECGNYVVVEHTGDIFSCDFFVDPEWHLGNLHSKDIFDMLNSEKQNNFGKLKSSLPQKCAKCTYLKYCHGGCIKDRRNSNDPSNVSHFCESYIAFFKHADSKMKTIAEEWKKSNSVTYQ